MSSAAVRPSFPVLFDGARRWSTGRAVFVGVALGLAVLNTLLLAVGSFAGDQDTASRLLSAMPGCWGFVIGGLVTCERRPDSRLGPLMMAVGVAWSLRWLQPSGAAFLSTVALALAWLWAALFLHLALASPVARDNAPIERLVIALTYAVTLGLQVARMIVLNTADLRRLGCNHCTNQLLIARAPRLGGWLDQTLTRAGAALALIGIGLFVVSWRRSEGPERRAQGPFVRATGVAGLAAVLYLSTGAAGAYGVADVFKWMQVVAFAVVPLALGYALVRARVTQAVALQSFLRYLGRSATTDSLGSALAEALDDPSVEVLYWVESRGYCTDVTGHPGTLPEEGDDRAVTFVEVEGQPVAAVVHHSWLRDSEDVVRAAGAAAALWFQRAQLEAELRLRVFELKESRSRIVEAGDVERRRIERDLHDGAQQRLASLLVHAKLTRRSLAADDPHVQELLDMIENGLADSLSELRALAAGILPPVLSDFGLGAALDDLAVRSPVATTIDVPGDRLPARLEVACYFVIAESAANAVKHARATRVDVRVHCEDGTVHVEVRDDGIGGANIASGTGLKGLADRIGALGGTLGCVSRLGAGTTVSAAIPLAQVGA